MAGGRGPMTYGRLARAYTELEGTTRRLEMTDVLVSLFLEAAPGEIDHLVHLTLGKLGPDHLGLELGLADKLVLKAVAENAGIPPQQVERMMAREGDIGAVAEKALSGGRQATLFAFGRDDRAGGGVGESGGYVDREGSAGPDGETTPVTSAGGPGGQGPLMVDGVFASLRQIAGKRDKDSQSKKLEIVKGLLNRASETEARYLVRTLVGKLRLGARDMTILDALAYAFHPVLDGRPGELEARAASLAAEAAGLADECAKGTAGRERGEGPVGALEGPARGLAAALTGLTGILRRMEGRTTSVVYDGVDSAAAAAKAAKPLVKAADRIPAGAEAGHIVEAVHRISRRAQELALLTEEVRAGVEKGREVLERAYILTSDLGKVASTLASVGLDAVSHLGMRAGVPVRSMLAERLGSVEEILAKMGGRAAFEYKYDGLRVQAHITPDGVRLFSRNLEDITAQFPDLIVKLKGAARADLAIVDGECLPVDPGTGEVLPFQVVSRRRGRKYGLATERSDGSLDGEAARTFEDDFPVVVVLFDILLAEGAPMVDEPYERRREALAGAFDFGGGAGDVRLSTQIVTSDPAEAGAFFDASLAEGCEGVVAKSVAKDSFYRAGARGWQWIKLKRDYKAEMTDTADLVVVGAFHGRGRRTGWYGALLMACFDPASGKYETVCKLGTGFTDEALAEMKGMLEAHLSEGRGERRPASVVSRMEPDVWFEPAVLLEVAGAEITLSPVHTCSWVKFREESGLAIRFPRYTGRLRDDKGPDDATTAEEMASMYERQLKRV